MKHRTPRRGQRALRHSGLTCPPAGAGRPGMKTRVLARVSPAEFTALMAVAAGQDPACTWRGADQPT